MFGLTSKEQRDFKESIIKVILQLISSVSILTTIGIVLTLFTQAFSFFQEVSLIEFFGSGRWTPIIKPRSFGVWPLIVGTMMIAIGSSIISIPIGLGSAIYLSEYASQKTSRIIKPILEILAGIPSIVYGFFALTFITPQIRKILPQTGVFNAVSASIAVGIMIIPMVASLSEEAMEAVPDSISHGAYALGASKFQVVVKIIIPAALSGIISSFILGISRAIGETMIVAIAAGANSQLNFNPLQSIQTMTGFMVNISMGDAMHGSIAYKTLFAVGSLLFLITLVMNILARTIVNSHREEY